MFYERKEILLKDGRTAILRMPSPAADAAEMLDYMVATAGETHYLLREPEECTTTVEQEEAYLRSLNTSPFNTMIVCEVGGKIAGNCQITFKNKLKNRHRAIVAIALLKEYWALGIGTAMFREMIRLAREQGGIEQLELEVIEGNERAIGLYEKMGFRIVGEKPNAIRLKDNTRLKEYYMVKEL